MTTSPADLLATLGAGPDALEPAARESLAADGHLVLDGLLPPSLLDRVGAVVTGELARADADPLWRPGGTLHLASLLDAGPAMDAVWTAPRLLAAVAELLGPDLRIARMHFRAPRPGFGGQALHTDVAGRQPPGEIADEATAIIALVDVDAAGGATRVVPGSHRWYGFRPPAQPDMPHPQERRVPLPAGSALVFSGHLWHSGTRNDAAQRRDALQLSFTRRTEGDAPDYPDVSTATFDRLGPAAMLLL